MVLEFKEGFNLGGIPSSGGGGNYNSNIVVDTKVESPDFISQDITE